MMQDTDQQTSSSSPQPNATPPKSQKAQVMEDNLILQQQNSRWKLLVGVLIFVLVLGCLYAFFRSRAPNSPSNSLGEATDNLAGPATLSGTVVYSGLIPASNPQAKIGIFLRPSGTSAEFTDTAIRLDLQATNWQYDQAIAGENYDVQAILFLDGANAASSQVVTVTAPALELPLVLDLNSTLGSVSADVPKTISGTITINGYLPNNSDISIISHETDERGRVSETVVYTFAAASEVMNYTLSNVDPARTYLFSAALNQGNREIGDSDEQLYAHVYDQNVNFSLDSIAQPVQTNYASARAPRSPLISGSVTINGPLRQNSRLLIQGKRPEESTFQTWQVLTNLGNSRIPWSYPSVVAGQKYDIQAVLQVNDEHINTSHLRTVTAPSTSANFTVNTNFSLATPDQSQLPQIEPCVRDGDAWVTHVVIPEIANAAQYWVKVNSRTFNQIVPANGGSTSVRISNLPNNQRNSVQFAYSYCRGCTDRQNFSSFSRSVSFTCQ